MKHFNLFKEIITTDKSNLINAINSSKFFGIDINGNITHEPFTANDILIYQGKHTQQQTNALIHEQTIALESILGKNYQVVEDGGRVLIKAFSNWQEIIGFNTTRATYDDTTADGVAEFSDKELENIGWHATEFAINYRELVEVLEEKCAGTMICIEQDEPYQFSGLGFLDNFADARATLFDFCQTKIKNLMLEKDEYKKENLTDDELEAAQYFGLIS
ncbi:hypothetical protein HUE87_02820 [Candidatus Sulfurimonas marisnigri]|uniref:Uncharacterized protein n=1 Tax=Candidatus Sulfurimonas marisnigri TaxID=2740405 RepID=A0A7S7M2Q8_9BACT|nr:hypothetical protein [Candidatus Sulfurimonas marisnigri]QOY55189.1 hypothetical protein HUE87_02820 [Candidatus Sulfurimonas marisnigri]